MQIIYLHNIISIHHYNMNFNIQKLKITLNTNAVNNTQIELTKDILYHPEHGSFTDIEKYPYLTTKQVYPEDYLSGLVYSQIVNIFFNKENFESMLIEHKPAVNIPDTAYISNKNIMIMLGLLFSTKYFIVNNIHQSLDIINKKESDRSIFYNPFNTQFSYIKINGKPHTVTKAIWLNDIVNHPKYKEVANTVGDVINSYNEKFPNNPDKLITERNRPVTSNVNFKEISYNLRNRVLPKLRFPYRESSNTEIQNRINMELVSPPQTDINNMSKRQLYDFLTTKVLTPIQKAELKGNLQGLEQRINDNSSKKDYIELIDKYNNYTSKFYDTFEKLYNRYMLNNKDIVIDKKTLDIGIDNINIGYSDNYPKKEIFVMLDLIDGEVNEGNKKEVYCPYTNEYLGNLLNSLVYNPESSKVVKNSKTIYSVEDKSTSSSSTKKNTNDDKVKPNTITEVDDNVFYSQIFNRSDNVKLLDKMRPFLANDNIIDFIKKNSDLYKIVSKSIATSSKRRAFMDEINRLNGRYKTEIQILNENKKGITDLPIKVKNIDNEILKYEFYSSILDKVIAYEDKKPMAVGGRPYSVRNNIRNKPRAYKNVTKKNR